MKFIDVFFILSAYFPKLFWSYLWDQNLASRLSQKIVLSVGDQLDSGPVLVEYDDDDDD